MEPLSNKVIKVIVIFIGVLAAIVIIANYMLT